MMPLTVLAFHLIVSISGSQAPAWEPVATHCALSVGWVPKLELGNRGSPAINAVPGRFLPGVKRAVLMILDRVAVNKYHPF